MPGAAGDEDESDLACCGHTSWAQSLRWAEGCRPGRGCRVGSLGCWSFWEEQEELAGSSRQRESEGQSLGVHIMAGGGLAEAGPDRWLGQGALATGCLACPPTYPLPASRQPLSIPIC
ncbi:hypothetical protein H1C71_011817, partial [Ictidomys tridecemlineatus]